MRMQWNKITYQNRGKKFQNKSLEAWDWGSSSTIHNQVYRYILWHARPSCSFKTGQRERACFSVRCFRYFLQFNCTKLLVLLEYSQRYPVPLCCHWQQCFAMSLLILYVIFLSMPLTDILSIIKVFWSKSGTYRKQNSLSQYSTPDHRTYERVSFQYVQLLNRTCFIIDDRVCSSPKAALVSAVQ